MIDQYLNAFGISLIRRSVQWRSINLFMEMQVWNEEEEEERLYIDYML